MILLVNFFIGLIIGLLISLSYKEHYLADYGKYKYCRCNFTLF